MAQLKMYWRTKPSAYPQCPPEFSFRTMQKTQEDVAHWVRICKNGLLHENDGAESFAGRMFDQEGFDYDTVFFVEKNGVPVATAAAIVRPGGELGYLHMVSVDNGQRGKGIGTLLNEIVRARFAEKKVKGVYLTTDEWRVPAIKSYLRADFLPVLYDEGMPERWNAWLRDYDYSKIEMVNEDGVFACWLNEG